MYKQVSFTIIFDGDSVKDGTIDVKNLAPALLSLNEILTDANRLIKNDFDITLNVKSLPQGSFDVDLIVAISGFIEEVVKIFSSNEVTSLTNLLQILGISGGLYGLFKLIKKSKGKKPQNIRFIDEKEVVVFEFDDETIEAPKGTEILYNDRKIRENSRKFLKPLESEGIDRISFKKDDEIFHIDKGEERYFEIPEEREEPLLDRTDEKIFQIIQLWFKEENKWKLFDGISTYFVTIKDTQFLDKIDKNKESFSKGSLLKVKLRTYQFRRGIDLNTEYEIIEVLEHIKPREQLSFLNNNV
jgi:hypothetical protein